MKRLMEIKDKIVETTYEEIKHNFGNINIKELGDTIDMIKDLSESIYHMSIVKAMEEKFEDKDWEDEECVIALNKVEKRITHMEEANKQRMKHIIETMQKKL